LAVDADGFSAAAPRHCRTIPDRKFIGRNAGAAAADWRNVIVATGPLTSATTRGRDPRTHDEETHWRSSMRSPVRAQGFIDMSAACFNRATTKWAPVAPRRLYQLPPSQEQYDAFVDALIAGGDDFKSGKPIRPIFDGCLPIEVMPSAAAKRCVTGR